MHYMKNIMKFIHTVLDFTNLFVMMAKSRVNYLI